MNFYYVNEKNEPRVVQGTNKQIYEAVLKAAKDEPSKTGFIGVVSKDKLRAVLIFHAYHRTVYTTVTQFIRKHAARAALERLCK